MKIRHGASLRLLVKGLGSVIFLISLSFFSVGFRWFWSKPPQETRIALQWITANNAVGIEAFRTIALSEASQNVLTCPLGVLRVIGLAERMMATDAVILQIPGMEQTSLADRAVILQALKDEALKNWDHQVHLIYQDSIWTDRSRPLDKSFSKTIRKRYGSTIQQAVFDEHFSEQANSWFSKITKGGLSQVTIASDPGTRTLVAGGISVKGLWAAGFDPSFSTPKDFKTPGGIRQVPMMQRSGYEAYLHHEKFQAVRLLYGDGKVALYVFLPDAAIGLEGFYQELNLENLENWFAEFLEREGDIALPRIKMHFLQDMVPVLQKYDQSRDPSLRVSFAAFFEMDETGSPGDSSAALAGTGDLAERFQITVDRPFFFAVRDNQNGMLLLLGAVTDPS